MKRLFGLNKPEIQPTTQAERDAAAKAYGDAIRARNSLRHDGSSDTGDKEGPTLSRFDQGMRRLLKEKDTTRYPISPYRKNYDRRYLDLIPVSAKIVGFIAAASVISFATSSAVDNRFGDDRAKSMVEQYGYKDVTTGGTRYAPFVFGCGEGDVVRYDLIGSTNEGVKVDVMVCKGLFKGATLREGGIVQPDVPSPVNFSPSSVR